MAKIVLGIGMSHSPALTGDGDVWLQASARDRKNRHNLLDGSWRSYDELLAEAGDRFADESSRESVSTLSDGAQRALDRLADEISQAKPDVILIVGDDHNELFRSGVNPSFAVYTGDEVVMYPWGEAETSMPPFFYKIVEGCKMDTAHRFPGAPDIARALIEHMTDAGVDTTVVEQIVEPTSGGLGHSCGFVVKRLIDASGLPVVPILLNTYYPPNVMRPGRCYDVGRALASAIERLPDDLRIAVVASGGLSHTVTDDIFDRAFLNAMCTQDEAYFRSMSPAGLIDGTSEVLVWVLASGAFEGLTNVWCEYFPIRRTPAGTGVGVGFAAWHPANRDADQSSQEESEASQGFVAA